ncbi:helix-turn-helix transcriptional regulator [Paraburkholderia lycopersici]|uniref:Prophage regulatory protein n=1 Tax=Paraburkholderia lycopersici TaxID=416944 RepID=A0A1G6K4G4_9BURK|nr:prophage regulatory protein [Paraburkholderia lycopersici]
MKAIRIKEVAAKVGLGQSTLYRMMADGTFPKPFHFVPGRIAWVESDIDEWLAGRVRGGISEADATHATEEPPAAAGQRILSVTDGAREAAPRSLDLIERNDIEALARRIAAWLSPHALWDLAEVAAYLHCSVHYTREAIILQDDFPRRIRIPSGGGASERVRGLWRSKEVIAWAESHAE